MKRKSFFPFFILLLGALSRLIALGSVPGGMHQDEALTAWNAFALFHEGMDSAGNHFPIYVAGWGDGQSAMATWITAPFLLFSGGHITPLLARIPQAVLSVFTLWVVYCLMKRLFDAKAGLWSLFLLAICPWHIMMSRWGLDANFAPGFLMFGLYFFIRGLEQEKFLPISALFYGLSLYCYAVIWPIVPLMLALQIIYGLYHKKLRINRWSLLSCLLLFVLALPLILFVVINSFDLPPISLLFITIPRMSGFRGSEIAWSLSGMLSNLRNSLSLLWRQNTGNPYDFLLPWGLFYDIGRIFIVIGIFALLKNMFMKFRSKTFAPEFFLFAQLVGGGLVCLLVTAKQHQINALYIPLVLSEAYGVWVVTEFVLRKKELMGNILIYGLSAIYLVCLLLFQIDYYTDYRQLTDAYFAKGLEDCVDFAWEQCQEKGIATITVEKGAQWPRLLLYTETLPSEYLASVVYDVAPAPASFDTKGIHINTRIHYDSITQESVYIIYFTDVPVFEKDFTLTRFHDWYVAVPVDSP
ncbi:MAG: glycosyltransferase family 39 protein [Firmicutes bacterium]|nr:glycosyltransferase family 39 protein [Bacillota bacterium]